MRSKYQGFTLTELLIVIAIAAIMAAIAFPNMSQWIASRRAASQAEQVANLLRFARSEAVRLNLPVYVCPAQIKVDGNPDNYCKATYEGQGMVAFADTDKNGSYTRNTDVDLRTVILNAKDEQRTRYQFNIYSFSGAKQPGSNLIWAFYPNGTFGHAANAGAGSTFSIGSGFVKISITDAAAKDDRTKAARASILVIDSGGRVQKCESSVTGTIAKLCKYKDE
ncbi:MULTISPECIES: GspH/FimT family pseudopilin [unclassified Neisseria]|uniref:GspH/FimT family pseudopilin n=1 Tax=unclassified Neisseria TaxID=2623750 RepID=UPI001071E9AD|nr:MULTISPECIES: GspH/FimT family pseudopilin [unclassified Neisseria]MBF0804818.1 GspH/FimT family pseudopilin [Neisseria sp. 19428wB4_WF04]TFU39476.1 prepilin-type N-terminal cleavage/methylation domain-containing protein [Neisseria sp. WF04]